MDDVPQAQELGTDRITRYWSEGFLLPTRIFSQHEAQVHRSALETLLETWTGAPTLRRPMTDYCRANFHIVSRWGAQIAQTPAILDAVESIIGPDILLWMTEVIIKEPSAGKKISMHQDLTYWGMSDQDKQVTAWLALTDARPANGAMQFVPGSHKLGQVHHNDTFAEDNLLSRGQEVAVDYDPSAVVDCTLKAGEMSLHHGLLFHGSGPNITNDRRIGIVMRFISPEMRQVQAARDYALVVRGANRTNNFINVAPPARDFDTAALALYEEIDSAQREALAHGATGEFKYGRQ